MAKDTIEAIKIAEQKANEIVQSSKEESTQILNKAMQDKKAILKEANTQIAMDSNELEQKAFKEAETLKSANSSDVTKTLADLDDNYNAKKSEAIAGIIDIVLA